MQESISGSFELLDYRYTGEDDLAPPFSQSEGSSGRDESDVELVSPPRSASNSPPDSPRLQASELLFPDPVASFNDPQLSSSQSSTVRGAADRRMLYQSPSTTASVFRQASTASHSALNHRWTPAPSDAPSYLHPDFDAVWETPSTSAALHQAYALPLAASERGSSLTAEPAWLRRTRQWISRPPTEFLPSEPSVVGSRVDLPAPAVKTSSTPKKSATMELNTKAWLCLVILALLVGFHADPLVGYAKSAVSLRLHSTCAEPAYIPPVHLSSAEQAKTPVVGLPESSRADAPAKIVEADETHSRRPEEAEEAITLKLQDAPLSDLLALTSSAALSAIVDPASALLAGAFESWPIWVAELDKHVLRTVRAIARQQLTQAVQVALFVKSLGGGVYAGVDKVAHVSAGRLREADRSFNYKPSIAMHKSAQKGAHVTEAILNALSWLFDAVLPAGLRPRVLFEPTYEAMAAFSRQRRPQAEFVAPRSYETSREKIHAMADDLNVAARKLYNQLGANYMYASKQGSTPPATPNKKPKVAASAAYSAQCHKMYVGALNYASAATAVTRDTIASLGYKPSLNMNFDTHQAAKTASEKLRNTAHAALEGHIALLTKLNHAAFGPPPVPARQAAFAVSSKLAQSARQLEAEGVSRIFKDSYGLQEVLGLAATLQHHASAQASQLFALGLKALH